MSGNRKVTISEIEEVQTPQRPVDDEIVDGVDDFDPDDFSGSDENGSDEDDSEGSDSDDDVEEEGENLGSLFQYFLTNDNGENVADILTGLKSSIDMHNKLIYKILQKM